MSAGAHLFHAILTILFFPWALVWLVCAIACGNNTKKKDRELMERQTAAMEKLADIQKWKSYRD